jgi:hypothetical protein
VGKGIIHRDNHEKITYSVIDPSAFKWDGGPSHAERMADVEVLFRKADNNRIGGWDMVRDRLCGDKDPREPTHVSINEPVAFKGTLQDIVNNYRAGNNYAPQAKPPAPEPTTYEPGTEDMVGVPMWYCFKTCVALIRTLPALQHDLIKPEDCDTDGEDHAPDALRYGLMSRPWTRKKSAKGMAGGDVLLLQEATFNDIWEDYEASLQRL